MFCAANLRDAEGVEAVILERTNSPLKKVILSGGGRCNFTNTEIDGGNPKAFYPRGAGFLRKPLMGYGCAKTREFFKTLGVESKVEDCGRVFPVSDDSRTIAGALERAAKKARLICGAGVESVEKTSDGRWNITYIDEFGRGSRGNVPRRGTDIADFSGCGCDTAPMEAVCAKPNKARGEQPSEGEHKQSGEGARKQTGEGARNIVAADFILFAQRKHRKTRRGIFAARAVSLCFKNRPRVRRQVAGYVRSVCCRRRNKGADAFRRVFSARSDALDNVWAWGAGSPKIVRFWRAGFCGMCIQVSNNSKLDCAGRRRII